MKHEDLQGVKTRLGEAIRTARELQQTQHFDFYAFEDPLGRMLVSSELQLLPGAPWVWIKFKGPLLYVPGEDSLYIRHAAPAILQSLKDGTGRSI